MILYILLFAILDNWISQCNGSKAEQTATLLFGGDLSLSGAVRYFAQKGKGCNYKKPFDKIRKHFHNADFSIVNLEGPITELQSDINSPLFGKAVILAAEKQSLEGLKYLGVSAVQLANNHLMDYGQSSVNSTVDALKATGIPYTGITAGKKKYNPQKALIKDVKGIRLGILSYCFVKEGCSSVRSTVSVGPAVYDRQTAMKDIHRTKQKYKVDHVIVMPHWGSEYLGVPPKKIWKEVFILQQFGADIIVGTHPHVRQTHFATVNFNNFVEFSLGNLLYMPHSSYSKFLLPSEDVGETDEDQYIKTANYDWDPTRYGYLLKLTVSKKRIKSASMLHYNIIQNGPCLQPTPYDDKWRDVCDSDDSFCNDLVDVYGKRT